MLFSEGDIVIPSVCPLCYLLLNRWTKFNQIWCVSYSHEWGVQRQFFLPRPLGHWGRGQKLKYHLISITKSISKIFIPNFMFVLTNERNQNISDGILILLPGSPQGFGGAKGVIIFFFFQTWSCDISKRQG